ncbi:uncharacterized protein LOC116337247 [Contarinia nasturtii]|uniref:uncharacterized protein LOC116337247 n=1 Tax=Contarinia nasturtii TaxID=265458 RepID=UPI0012D3745A|nr:uncharacterized protein LOC116337247 [Contarinia nasturtii]
MQKLLAIFLVIGIVNAGPTPQPEVFDIPVKVVQSAVKKLVADGAKTAGPVILILAPLFECDIKEDDIDPGTYKLPLDPNDIGNALNVVDSDSESFGSLAESEKDVTGVLAGLTSGANSVLAPAVQAAFLKLSQENINTLGPMIVRMGPIFKVHITKDGISERAYNLPANSLKIANALRVFSANNVKDLTQGSLNELLEQLGNVLGGLLG